MKIVGERGSAMLLLIIRGYVVVFLCCRHTETPYRFKNNISSEYQNSRTPLITKTLASSQQQQPVAALHHQFSLPRTRITRALAAVVVEFSSPLHTSPTPTHTHSSLALSLPLSALLLSADVIPARACRFDYRRRCARFIFSFSPRALRLH